MRRHELDRAVTQVRLEERVPEDHHRRRSDADGLTVDGPGLVADLVDANLRVRHPLPLLQALDDGRDLGIADRLGPDRRQQRPDHDEDGADGDEQRRDDRPPATREPPRQRHHDREHDRDGCRLGEHAAPLAEHEAPVLLLRDPVPPVPPETRQANRQRREGDEQRRGDPDHHARADLAERETAGEPPAEQRQHGENGQLHRDGEEEEQAANRAVARRFVQLRVREER